LIAWLAELRVKVAADGIDIDRWWCRPAHCRRVRLCRRTRRRRDPVGAGGCQRRPIPGAAARASGLGRWSRLPCSEWSRQRPL